jgi:membrane-bound ClpP family serine protease
MMQLIILLFSAGVLLVSAEVFVPGGIIGALGGLCMLGGTLLAFVEFGPGGGLAALSVAFAALAISLYVEIRILPRTKHGRKLFLAASISGTSSPPPGGAELVGKTCEAVTPLGPTGVVLLDGKRYEAFSRSGFIDVGQRLQVSGYDNFRLIVSLP